MTETTTIQVRKDQAKKLKEIQGPSGNYKTVIDTLIESHDTQPDNNTGVDYDRLESMLDEKLQYHLAEWEITVNMDQLDLDQTGVNEADVRTMIDAEIEKLKAELY